LKRLNVVEPAEQEYRETTAWYRDRDERVAARFAAEARRTLQLIEQFPQIGGRVPQVDDASIRRMPIHNFPYHIVFVDLGDVLEVVAFAHNRRQPGYFMDRVRRR
jgi:plasmid stabilization system protein ParE